VWRISCIDALHGFLKDFRHGPHFSAGFQESPDGVANVLPRFLVSGAALDKSNSGT
jgi:hypothetical protein